MGLMHHKKDFFHYLKKLKHAIICLQETHIKIRYKIFVLQISRQEFYFSIQVTQ